jgi:hypothetical protein
MMLERRQWPRRRTFEGARIVFGDKKSVRTCTVVNMSDQGANLRLPDISDIPDTFELHIGNKVHAAWVVWKADGTLGVTWIT